jgi:hypothetical protein
MAINAINDDDGGSTFLLQEHLIHAADLQSVSMVDMSDFCQTYTPLQRINELPLGRLTQDEIRNIAKVYHLLQNEQPELPKKSAWQSQKSF